MAELKPCPFCGGEAGFVKSRYGWMSLDEEGKEICGDSGYVRCYVCRNRTIETREEWAIKFWNRREGDRNGYV